MIHLAIYRQIALFREGKKSAGVGVWGVFSARFKAPQAHTAVGYSNRVARSQVDPE